MKRTLYKRASTGKVQVWAIEIEGDTYRSISGEDGGKMTTSTWTRALPKNVGRSNETTGAQQAALEAEAKYQDKLKSGYGPDKNRVDSYAQAIDPMLAEKWTKYGTKSLLLPLASQPKLDGIRSIGTLTGLFSREGNPFVSCPHIEADVRSALQHLPAGAKLDGELYNHQFKDNFNAIVKLIKRENCTATDLENTRQHAQYHVYDIDLPGLTFTERYQLLTKIKALGLEYIHIVETVFHEGAGKPTAPIQEELDTTYGRWLEEGYEGQMVRITDSLYQHKRTKSLLKRKETLDEEFAIVDITEGKGNRSGMAGRVHFKTREGKPFEAGLRGNSAYFKQLLSDKRTYIGKKATVRFQNYTPDGKPRFGVMVAVRDYE